MKDHLTMNGILKNDSFRETLQQGLVMGLALFVSALLGLRVTNRPGGMEFWWRYCTPLLFLYLAAGVLICWLRSRPKRSHPWTQGITVLTWFSIFFVLFLLSGGLIPDSVHHILTGNGAALLLLWFLDYYQLTGIAKELNQGRRRSKILIIDLEEKPAGDEAFLELFEDFCVRNHLTLEYEERAVPALVKLDGVEHRVELSYYYGYGGIVYTMVIRQL